MSTKDFFLTAWEFQPASLVLCIVLLVAYGVLYRFRSPRKVTCLSAGLAIFLLILASPIHALSDSYLFSAHMVLHLVLLLIVPLLLVSSLPPISSPLRPWQSRVMQVLTWPPLTWLAGLGGMWLWHQPDLFHAAQESARIHELHIISLVVAGSIFWLPIIGPDLQRRISPLAGILYLFSACIGCTILGIGITFARPGLYAMSGEDPYRISYVIQHRWGMTQMVDQQVAGLLMWVPPCFVYASGVICLLARMYRSPLPADEAVDQPPGFHGTGPKTKEH